MNVVKCDRCGAITSFPTHKYSRIKASWSRGAGYLDFTNEFDLCPDCARAFAGWMGVEYDSRTDAMGQVPGQVLRCSPWLGTGNVMVNGVSASENVGAYPVNRVITEGETE